jgi:hypothetical protein
VGHGNLGYSGTSFKNIYFGNYVLSNTQNNDSKYNLKNIIAM